MKAKDYFEKFEMSLINSGNDIPKMQLVMEMLEEASRLKESRRVRSMDSYIAILKEMNQRWNAMVTLFEKKHGSSPIARNEFSVYIDKIIEKQGGALE